MNAPISRRAIAATGKFGELSQPIRQGQGTSTVECRLRAEARTAMPEKAKALLPAAKFVSLNAA